MFMVPTTDVLNRFHDKKRKLNYVKITSKLKAEEERKKNGGKLITTKEVVINDVRQKIKNRLLTKLDFYKEDQKKAFHEYKVARKRNQS